MIVDQGTTFTGTTLAREHRGIPFVLEDGTGRAIVDPTHARVTCAVDQRDSSAAAFDVSPRERALLERHSLIDRNWWSTTGIHYREAVIALDETITLVGMGTREPDPDTPPTGERGYREGGSTRMRFTGTAKYSLISSDDPKVAMIED